MLCCCRHYLDSARSSRSLASKGCAITPWTALFVLEPRILDEPLASASRFRPSADSWITRPPHGTEADEKIANEVNLCVYSLFFTFRNWSLWVVRNVRELERKWPSWELFAMAEC